MTPLDLLEKDLRFILFGGKGGVGKTTCAAAAALHMARRGRKTLVFSTDPAHSLSDSFDQDIGREIKPVEGVENLYALEIESEEVYRDYMDVWGEAIKQILRDNTILEEAEIDEVTSYLPAGFDEIMAIYKLIDIKERHEYDSYIIDTAPGPHTLRLLATPGIYKGLIGHLGTMRGKTQYIVYRFFGKYLREKADEFLKTRTDAAERVRAELMNPGRTQFVAVTIPEAMGIYETEIFIETLKALKIPVEHIIVNGLVPNTECGFCQSRRKREHKYLAEIYGKFPGYKVTEVPLFPHEVRGIDGLTEFAEALSGTYKPKPTPLKKLTIRSTHASRTLDLLKNDGPKFILFGGKGGVGKTTCAAAAALHMARRGRKTLVFSTDPAQLLSASFDLNIEREIKPVEGVENLHALEINAKELYENFKEKNRREIEVRMGFIREGGLVQPFERETMENLMEITPTGLDEIMVFIEVMKIIRETGYDVYVLDTAPTGHVLRLLAMPDLYKDFCSALNRIRQRYLGLESQFFLDLYGGIISVYATGMSLMGMEKETEDLKSTLNDPRKTQFVAVTIPEAMGIYETEDLLTTLKTLGIPLKHIVINRVVPDVECGFCQSRRKTQRKYVEEVYEKFPGYRVTEVPLFPHEVRGIDGLTEFAEALFKPNGIIQGDRSK